MFLAGTIFLFISPRLGWRPVSILPLDETADYRVTFFAYLSFFIWFVVFSSLVAYYMCFWSQPKPVRRILLAVFAPTLLGLALILNRYFQPARSRISILDRSGGLATAYEWFRANLWRFPTGVYFCAIGLILLGIFTVRIHLALSTLPISVPQRSSGEEPANSWEQYKWLIFLLVGPYFLITSAFILLLGTSYLLGHRPQQLVDPRFTYLAMALDSWLLIGIILLVIGKDGREVARNSVQLPEPRYALFGLLLPIVVGLACAALPYAIDRAQWAAYSFGKTSPPQFYSYFDVDRAWDPWLLFLLFGALTEEIIFRGVLLPRLMRQYGLHRGLFFTGIVWAAFHFRSDSYSALSVPGVLYHLVWRILFCLALNHVFSWMTLRWRSVIPSTVAHTVWNMIALSGMQSGFAWSAKFDVVLWAGVALVLFHYWPPRDEEGETVGVEAPNSVTVV